MPGAASSSKSPTAGMAALFAAVLILAAKVPPLELCVPVQLSAARFQGLVLGVVAAALLRLFAFGPGTVSPASLRWAAGISGTCAALGVAQALLGFPAASAGLQVGFVHGASSLLVGLLQGVGLGGLALCWAQMLPLNDFAATARELSKAILLGTVPWLCSCFFQEAVPALTLGAIGVSSALAGRAARRAAHQPMQAGGSAWPGAVLKRTWVPLAGLTLCSFIIGLTYDVVAAEVGAETPAKTLASGLGGAAVALAIACFPGTGSRAGGQRHLLREISLPLAIALILVSPVLEIMAGGGEAVAGLCGAISTAGFSVLTVMGTSALLEAAAAFKTDPGRVAAGALLICAAAALAGSLVIGVVGSGGRIACMLAEVALITSLAIWCARGNPLVEDRAPQPSPGEAQAKPPVQVAERRPDFNGRCDELASRYLLSPREREVLELLGYGYGSGYAADKLGISENTVRTHARHIYEKLGVTSREALIDLLR